MPAVKNLSILIQEMNPILHPGEYVFSTVTDINHIDRNLTICEFKEAEGTTIVIEKSDADALKLTYNFIASWITLTVHSALEAVGLTAIFSTALAKHNISCNVIAGYYHDHIFVASQDARRALNILKEIASTDEPSSK